MKRGLPRSGIGVGSFLVKPEVASLDGLSARSSKEISDFHADELDVLSGEGLVGRQSEDARAQMLSDGKLAAAHA